MLRPLGYIPIPKRPKPWYHRKTCYQPYYPPKNRRNNETNQLQPTPTLDTQENNTTQEPSTKLASHDNTCNTHSHMGTYNHTNRTTSPHICPGTNSTQTAQGCTTTQANCNNPSTHYTHMKKTTKTKKKHVTRVVTRL